MGPIDLAGLSSKSFETLIQALSIKVLGHGAVIFGDGPDGGREAIFQGKVPYPSEVDQWDGYTVVQAKFLAKPKQDMRDATWLASQLDEELKKFTVKGSLLKKPEYYILVTNVNLSSVVPSNTKAKKALGGKVKIDQVFDKYKDKLKLKGFAVWDYDKICTFLDAYPEVRQSYAAWITSSDVLDMAVKFFTAQTPDFAVVMRSYLQRELRIDQNVNLKQAGYTAEADTALANVFVDIPYRFPKEVSSALKSLPEYTQHTREQRYALINSFVEWSKLKLDPITRKMSDYSSSPVDPDPSKFVIIGGPGQGKSTAAQFLAQLFRASLIKNSSSKVLSPDTVRICEDIEKQCKSEKLELPSVRRYPIKVDLPKFADDLRNSNGSEKLSILRFITNRISRLTDHNVSIQDMRSWLSIYPWILIFDGLDEVPASGNRDSVISAINDFWDEVNEYNADVLVIVTTRPQGYNSDLEPKLYHHLYLQKLLPTEALHYGTRLISSRFTDPDAVDRMIARLTAATKHAGTARLLTSPLQVTIMAALIDAKGDVPQDRWSLFSGYYSVIRDREISKEGPTTAILKTHAKQIEVLHYNAGLLLQTESEEAGGAESHMSFKRLMSLIAMRLQDEGYTGSNLQTLTENIKNAATERLVFLVAQEDDKVGFEIRSLQEFTGAAALMAGSDERIRDRLRHISDKTHWRNVFLIAANKCFSDFSAEHFRDTILAICDELNGFNGQDVGRSLVGIGSQLALELLEDGAAHGQPLYINHLTSKALCLLQFGQADFDKRLALVYDDLAEELYIKVIEPILVDSSQPSYLSAWRLLFNLDNLNKQWATAFIEKYLPTSPDERLRVLILNMSVYDTLTNKWLEKLDMATHEISSLDILPRELRGSWSYASGNDNGSLVTSFLNILYFRHRLNEVDIFTSTAISKAHYHSVKSDRFKIFEDRKLSQAWSFFKGAAIFTKSPNAQSLSDALKLISDDVAFISAKRFAYLAPWPLATLISNSKTYEELGLKADQARNGLYGDVAEWLLAEERWNTLGITDEDLLAGDLETCKNEIATRGSFTLHGTVWNNISESSSKLPPLVSKLLKIMKASQSPSNSVCFLLLVTLSVDERAKFISNIEDAKLALSALEISDIAINYSYFATSTISSIDDKILVKPEIIDFINQSSYANFDSLFKNFKASYNCDILINAFNDHLDKRGLLPWIVMALFETDNFEKFKNISDSAFETVETDSTAISVSSLLIRLVCQMPYTSFDFSKLNATEVDYILSSIESIQQNLGAKFIPSELLKDIKLHFNKTKSPPSPRFMHVATKSLDSIKSGFREWKIWNELDLPKALFPFILDQESSS